ncbi:MAG: hypothetical protein ACQERN_04815 [Thermodesulfobacteriota bacterium]
MDFIGEGNEAINDELDKEIKPFLAWKITGEKGGFAVSYFTPYVFGQSVADDGTVVDRLDVYSFGGAYTFPYRIRMGGTFEFIELETDADYDHTSGVSGSIGAHWVPLDYRPWGVKMQFGGVYRFESTIDDEDYEGFNKPVSWNYGASLMKSITPLRSNLIVSAQYEKTDFSVLQDEWGEEEMMSYGVEWQIVLNSFITRMALRAGMYSEEPDGVDSNFEMNGSTYGVGLRFGKKWGLEYSMENREWENPDYSYKKDFTLHALAVTYSHQFD